MALHGLPPWALALAFTTAVANCGGRVAPLTSADSSNSIEVLARVTGPAAPISWCPDTMRLPSTNDTVKEWGVGGVDLGIAWDTGRGEVAFAFGDTFAEPEKKTGWRHNTLAFSNDRDPSDGITFTRMLEDQPGHAGEIVGKTPGIVHEGVIPTGGIAVGPRNYLFFMSVKEWGLHGHWTTNYSSIAYSDDGAATWQRADAHWPASSRFAQTTLVHDDTHLYVFGTPAGRLDAVYLARVGDADVLRPEAYEYFGADGAWKVGDESLAAPVAPAPIGELSVQHNAATGLWRMTYLNQTRGMIVMRTSPALTGPWSDEVVLVDRNDPKYPMVYGGFQHPWFKDGPDLYLMVSKMACYDVFLFHVATPDR
jgi:hypothetical protein